MELKGLYKVKDGKMAVEDLVQIAKMSGVKYTKENIDKALKDYSEEEKELFYKLYNK